MDEQLIKILRHRAVQLLAQRDHSSYELSQKLALFLTKQRKKQLEKQSRKPLNEPNQFVNSSEFLNFDENPQSTGTQFSAEIMQVIDYCITHRWLNDAEYIKKYTDMQSRKGYGRYRIAMELKQRGLPSDTIPAVFAEVNWIDVATQQIIKKFKQIDAKDMIQKKKVIQFLLSKGFAQDEIKTAYKLLAS